MGAIWTSIQKVEPLLEWSISGTVQRDNMVAFRGILLPEGYRFDSAARSFSEACQKQGLPGLEVQGRAQ